MTLLSISSGFFVTQVGLWAESQERAILDMW